jgi:hypothetical protein
MNVTTIVFAAAAVAVFAVYLMRRRSRLATEE